MEPTETILWGLRLWEEDTVRTGPIINEGEVIMGGRKLDGGTRRKVEAGASERVLMTQCE